MTIILEMTKSAKLRNLLGMCVTYGLLFLLGSLPLYTTDHWKRVFITAIGIGVCYGVANTITGYFGRFGWYRVTSLKDWLRAFSFATPDNHSVDEAAKAVRPHWWTIMMALAALLISLLSLYFSWRAFNLSQSTSRAVIQASTMKLLSDWSWDMRPGAIQQPIKVEMTLSNSGKSLANGISAILTLNGTYESQVKDKEILSGTSVSTGSGYTKLLPDDMGPGATRAYQMDLSSEGLALALTHAPGFNGKVTRLTISPSFEYSDPTGSFKDELCFSIRADENGVTKAGTIYPCNTIAKGTVTLP